LEAKTDANGSFVFSGLFPGEWTVTAFPPSDDANFTVARESLPFTATVVAGSTEQVELRLRTVNLTGRVFFTGLGGKDPVEGAKVWAFLDEDADGRPDASTGEGVLDTDARGYFSFLLPPGKYALQVEPPAGYPRPSELTYVTITQGQANPVEVEILLSIPMHGVSGFVKDQHGQPVDDARIIFLGDAESGWSSVNSGADGNFSVNLMHGVWEVMVTPRLGASVDWNGNDAYQVLSLPESNAPQGATLDLRVERRASAGTLLGKVARPDGSTDWGSYASEVSVEVSGGPGSVSEWKEVDANGSFSFTLEPGRYELKVFVGSSLGYAAPKSRVATVTAGGIYDAGDVMLLQMSATITGTLLDDEGNALSGFYVYAVNPDGDMIATLTGANGVYRMSVLPGNWEVAYETPLPFNGRPSPYLGGSPKATSVSGGQSAQVSFIVEKTTRTVEGTLVTADGNLVTGLRTWVYARRASESAGAYSFVADAYVDGLGRFEIMLPKEGEFRVGTWLPDTADYSMVSETMVGPNDAKAAVVLRPHDAVVSGVFTLDGQPISGRDFYANVAAHKVSDGEPVFKTAAFSLDGTFELRLEEGSWGILYNVINHDLDTALRESNRRFLELEVTKGQALNLEVPLVRINGELNVVVLDENNASVKEGVYPWVEQDDGRGKFYKDMQLYGGDVFKAPIPLPMRVRVGAKISKELRSAGYLEPEIEKVRLDTTQNTMLVTLRMIYRKPDEFLAGMVTDEHGSAIPGAFVWAWSPRGQTMETHADANGSFRFEVKAGAKWYLGADFAGGVSTGGAVLLMDKDVEVDLTTAPFRDDLHLILRPSSRQLPDAAVDTFDPSLDYHAILSDGTRLFIPANSILLQIRGGRGRGPSIQFRKGMVTMTVTPVQTGLAKGINNRPLDFGYSISFTEDNGRETQISKAARLSIPFSAASLIANKARKEDLALSYYSTTSGWLNVPAVLSGGYLHAYVDHFSKWAITVAPPEVRPSSLPNLLVSGLNADPVTERWYQSDWLGSFNDTGSGWIYHDEHGWLYPAEDGSGNYWLYHPNLGWLWTGPSLYGNAEGHRYLFSPKADSWLYYESTDKTFYVYKDSTRMNHAGTAVARLQATSSDASFGRVTGGGYHEVGSMVKLTAVANLGYRFTEWRSSTRGALGDSETLDVQVDGGESITGVFAKMTSEEILGGVFD
ncbi:MAG: hypothetical protein O3B25_15220, partial [Verrucomicrobia bacterium]|nr:hypothetical protein [Verrucomicrobiota bacterium]